MENDTTYFNVTHPFSTTNLFKKQKKPCYFSLNPYFTLLPKAPHGLIFLSMEMMLDMRSEMLGWAIQRLINNLDSAVGHWRVCVVALVCTLKKTRSSHSSTSFQQIAGGSTCSHSVGMLCQDYVTWVNQQDHQVSN